MISEFLITLFIGTHLFLKIFLWGSLVVLALYIFVLEGRLLLTKAKINKIIGKVTKKGSLDNGDEEARVSFAEKKLNVLIILWAVITLLTIVLTVTY